MVRWVLRRAGVALWRRWRSGRSSVDGNGADNLSETMGFPAFRAGVGRAAGFPELRKGGGAGGGDGAGPRCTGGGDGAGSRSAGGGSRCAGEGVWRPGCERRDGAEAARASGRAVRCGWGQAQPVGVAGPLRGAGRVGRAKKRAGPAALLGWIRWG